MTYPWPTLMPMGIVVISCVRLSVQPSMGLGLCIAYKALGRNGLQFGMLMYPDGLHSAFMDAYGYCCWSVCPSICPFVRLRHFQVAVHLQRRVVVIIGRWLLPSLVDTGDICCHYWQHVLVYIRNQVMWISILKNHIDETAIHRGTFRSNISLYPHSKERYLYGYVVSKVNCIEHQLNYSPYSPLQNNNLLTISVIAIVNDTI